MSNRISRKNVLRIVISLIIIALLLHKFDPYQVLSNIRAARIHYLALAALVYSFTFLILSSRWRMILSHMGYALPLPVAYQAFVGGMIISDLTPARVGDLSRPLLVRDRLDLSTGVASVVIDRYADILTTFILGVTGITLLVHKSTYIVLSLSTVLALLLGASALWVKRSFVIRTIERLGSPRSNSLANGLDTVISSMEGMQWILAKAVLMTAIAWITHALRLVLIAKSVGYDVPLGSLYLLQPLVSILALFPFTISGLGLVEGGMTALLSGLGVPVAAGISIALMDRAITVTFHVLAGGRYAARIL